MKPDRFGHEGRPGPQVLPVSTNPDKPVIGEKMLVTQVRLVADLVRAFN